MRCCGHNNRKYFKLLKTLQRFETKIIFLLNSQSWSSSGRTSFFHKAESSNGSQSTDVNSTRQRNIFARTPSSSFVDSINSNTTQHSCRSSSLTRQQGLRLRQSFTTRRRFMRAEISRTLITALKRTWSGMEATPHQRTSFKTLSHLLLCSTRKTIGSPGTKTWRSFTQTCQHNRPKLWLKSRLTTSITSISCGWVFGGKLF